MSQFLRFLLVYFLTGIISCNLFAYEYPATEIRAVWLTTNWNLDWPKADQSAENQKKQLLDILDELQQANINTVLFQVRIRGDVFYRSNIEPLSSFFQRASYMGPFGSYDPLEFAIEECHKRGLECHAWLVTYPLGTQRQIRGKGNNSVVSKHPDICKLHEGEWYLDPGNPQTQEYILNLVDEVVNNYDLNGVHFDYIRYPELAVKFPDKDTFQKYGQGSKDLNTWRRSNVTNLVTSVYDRVKSIKPWVQVSCSPIGRYRDLNPKKGKWTAYGSVHQDAGLWMQLGKMDAVYPMLYYKDEFGDYVEDWLKVSNGRFVVPGLGVYRMLPSEGNWTLRDITNQIEYLGESGAAGAALYRAGNVLDNVRGIKDALNKKYYSSPAKIPPMTWLESEAPNPPVNMQVYRDTNGLVTIEWESSNTSDEQTYTVYESEKEDFDLTHAKSILTTRLRGNKLYLDTPDTEEGIYYAVTASNRFHNESTPSFPVFFIHSQTLEK